MRRFKTYTLGCKVNQYETEAVEEMLEKEGYGHDESMDVDLAIINTCTVTNESDRKSRQIIRRHKRENPNAKWWLLAATPRYPPKKWRKSTAWT